MKDFIKQVFIPTSWLIITLCAFGFGLYFASIKSLGGMVSTFLIASMCGYVSYVFDWPDVWKPLLIKVKEKLFK